MLLTGEKICKKYGNEAILEGVDFSVDVGESVAVFGDSGRGKSTLISVLGLLLHPDSGSVRLGGRELLKLEDKEKSLIRNREFGFMFQHTQLIGSVSVTDNVLIPALLARRKGMENRAYELLDELKLSHRADHYPFQLSIGQKRRVSLARALLLEPQIIFADEPTNDLDEKNVAIVTDKLFEVQSKGKALVLVTHDKRLAARADRVFYL